MNFINRLKQFAASRPVAWRLRKTARSPVAFVDSPTYWESRYASGDNSGPGSYGKFAAFKASVLNAFVNEHNIQSVIEFGCGDGNQLSLAHYPQYLGLDVSRSAVLLCKERFSSDHTKKFQVLHEYSGQIFDLSLSLDVIFHLVEDHVFHTHMKQLFGAASRYVVIYSSNGEPDGWASTPHVNHRCFSRWIQEYCPDWRPHGVVPNPYPYAGDYRSGSFCDFYFYERR